MPLAGTGLRRTAPCVRWRRHDGPLKPVSPDGYCAPAGPPIVVIDPSSVTSADAASTTIPDRPMRPTLVGG